MDKILVLLSGGLDSCVALAKAVDECGKENVGALCIHYGQKHSKEIDCAKNIASYYGVKLYNLELASVFEGSDCTLIKGNAKIQKGDYSTQKVKGENIATYVPFRNGLFLSAAASVAISRGYNVLCYGAHKGDTAFDAYPDCTREFVQFMGSALRVGSGEKLSLYTPFIDLVKSDIVAIGIKLDAPFGLSWSCYNGSSEPCGECATCIDRMQAFRINQIDDPLVTKKQ